MWFARCKFAKPEFTYRLRWVAKRIHKSAPKFMPVTKSRKLHTYCIQLTCDQCRHLATQLALGGQMATNLCQLVYKFELDQSQYKRVATPNASPKFALTCINLQIPLARASYCLKCASKQLMIRILVKPGVYWEGSGRF